MDNIYKVTNIEVTEYDIKNIEPSKYSQLETKQEFGWHELKLDNGQYGVKVHHHFFLYEVNAIKECAFIKTICTFLVNDVEEQTMLDITDIAVDISTKEFDKLTNEKHGNPYTIPQESQDIILASLRFGRASQN